MPRYARKSTTKSFRRKTGYRKRFNRTTKRSIYRLSKRISAVSRRVAGEVNKFESNPNYFSNSLVVVGTSSANNTPLLSINSGVPYIYPLNWFYTHAEGSATGNVYANGEQLVAGSTYTLSMRNPLFNNTTDGVPDSSINQQNLVNDLSPGLQYRMKYIYINAIFNASINQSQNNTDGALRIVIVKDKQPTGGAATWADENNRTNSRGVFNANTINAQLNPSTVGRFKIMFDKTLRFNTTNGYKPFKYFKQLSTIVRNNRDYVDPTYYTTSLQRNNNLASQSNYLQTSNESPPVQKNAFYLMIFSDGLDFTYSQTNEPSTPAAGFKLFSRVAYYNN